MMTFTEKQIGENTFFLRPLPAFTCAHLSGELAAFLTPVIGGLAPIAKNVSGDFDVANLELDQIGPALSAASASVSGEKVETLLRKLLLQNGQISVCGPATSSQTVLLTEDNANEIFCGEIQDMYLLAFEVVKQNFSGFFKKIGTRFGNLESIQGKLRTLKDSGTSTGRASANLS